MAYHTTIFADARKDYSKTQSTLASLLDERKTPHSLIPIDPSPRSRPFRAFEDSVPTPPPDSARFAISQEELDQKAANAAHAARQHEFYVSPGVGNVTAEMRSWNGRRIEGPPPPLLESTTAAVAPVLSAVIDAWKAEIVRGKTTGRRELNLCLGRGYYHVLQVWRAVEIELRFVIARIKLMLLLIFSHCILIIMMLKAAAMLDVDDPRPGKVEWAFVNGCRSWSVGA
ncbi:hypothetical protein F4801DRAFT_571715 [Xylaria longipes]|nr:hypothetical protein F4801DRAFT_571715 [Xylaria longipes]